MDDQFYENFRQVHGVLVILGRRLQIFYMYMSLISEVLTQTDKARQQIRELGDTDLINSERRKEIDILFGDRMEI